MVTEWIVPSAAARAGFLGALDEIPIVQKLPNAERHEDLAAVDHRHTNAAEQLRRQAFDDDIASLRQGFGGNNRDAFASAGQIVPRLVAIAHRDRSESKTGNALFQRPRHVKPDRPKSRYSDRQRIPRHGVFSRLAAEHLAG